MTGNLDEAVVQIRQMSEKTNKLVSRTRRLLEVLDSQTKIISDSFTRKKDTWNRRETMPDLL